MRVSTQWNRRQARTVILARPGSRGGVAVEYAILLPAFLLLVLGGMDVGRIMWVQVTLERAAQAAARCASVNATICGSASATQAYAVTQAWGMTLAPAVFTVTTETCGAKVAASLPFRFTTPMIGSPDVTLQASACSPTLP